MKNKYEYLKKFLPPHPEFDGTNRNWFYPVEKDEIEEANKKLGFDLPTELVQFYREVGYGSLYAPHDAPEGYTAYKANYIIPPSILVGLYKPLEGGNREDEYEPVESEGYYMSGSTYKDLEPGDLPFFEICDGSSFLVMRPHSGSPNAVWTDLGDKVEDSFEKFIWRLYYESPEYHLKIVDPDYDKETK